MGIHDGHRDRLKQRFLEHGLDNFNDLNVLELLLFYAIPRRDTNELAHALLDHFGTLSAVLDASVQELTEVPGIGQNAALLLSLIPQLAKRRDLDKTRQIDTITSTSEAGRYLVPRLCYEKVEKVLLICLDSQKKVICCTEVGSGVKDSVQLSVRKVVETAVKNHANSVILAHNHPDGIAIPSREDEMMTEKIRKALQLLDITLVDHIIVAGREFISFTETGLIRYHQYDGVM